MTADHSVTHWIGELRAGNREAVQRLWEHYFQRLVSLARKRLGDIPRLPMDGEDVALSAFHSFFAGVEAGRFPRMDDRDNLWRVLVTLTVRKAARAVRDEHALKRGQGRTFSEGTDAACEDLAAPCLDDLISAEPTPEFAALVAEEYRRLMALLPDDELRTVALQKTEGYTTQEIATRMNRSLATVERKLRVIRTLWEA